MPIISEFARQMYQDHKQEVKKYFDAKQQYDNTYQQKYEAKLNQTDHLKPDTDPLDVSRKIQNLGLLEQKHKEDLFALLTEKEIKNKGKSIDFYANITKSIIDRDKKTEFSRLVNQYEKWIDEKKPIPEIIEVRSQIHEIINKQEKTIKISTTEYKKENKIKASTIEHEKSILTEDDYKKHENLTNLIKSTHEEFNKNRNEQETLIKSISELESKAKNELSNDKELLEQKEALDKSELAFLETIHQAASKANKIPENKIGDHSPVSRLTTIIAEHFDNPSTATLESTIEKLSDELKKIPESEEELESIQKLRAICDKKKPLPDLQKINGLKEIYYKYVCNLSTYATELTALEAIQQLPPPLIPLVQKMVDKVERKGITYPGVENIFYLTKKIQEIKDQQLDQKPVVTDKPRDHLITQLPIQQSVLTKKLTEAFDDFKSRFKPINHSLDIRSAVKEITKQNFYRSRLPAELKPFIDEKTIIGKKKLIGSKKNETVVELEKIKPLLAKITAKNTNPEERLHLTSQLKQSLENLNIKISDINVLKVIGNTAKNQAAAQKSNLSSESKSSEEKKLSDTPASAPTPKEKEEEKKNEEPTPTPPTIKLSH